tara:strand:+ start:6680 stop:7639 length:960 start_codon:yes stop_codon:yes gene_type:complete
MKILANDGISPIGEKMLIEAGYQVETTFVPQDQLTDYINKNDISVLLVRSATKVRQPMIDACKGLKAVGRGGVGLDNIDVDYAKDNGIDVFNTPGASSQAVAELVMGHMLSLARGLHDSNRQMPIYGNTEFKSLKKKYGKGIELRGKTMGVIGLGRIGQQTAKYALGLGMKVIGTDAFTTEATIDLGINGVKASATIKSIDFDTLLAESDFISLHVPAQADGKPVIGTEEIQKMKDGVILINLSRGGIINEADLLEGLNNGKIRGAAIDVYDNEPTPNGDILKHPNMSLTPHTGAATLEAQDRIGEELANYITTNFPLN